MLVLDKQVLLSLEDQIINHYVVLVVVWEYIHTNFVIDYALIGIWAVFGLSLKTNF